MIMLELFEEWDAQGLIPLMEKCFHPQQKVIGVSNYYIAKDWYDARQKKDYDLYATLVMLEKKYRLGQSRLYAIRRAFDAEVKCDFFDKSIAGYKKASYLCSENEGEEAKGERR